MVDTIDKKIVEILRENARISMRELGRLIPLSNSAVTERVKRLEDAGIIRGYQTVADEKMLGRPIHAFIIIEFTYENRGRPQRFLAYVMNNADVYAVHAILTAGMDYILEIYCKDMQALSQIQHDLYSFGLTTTYMAGEEEKSAMRQDTQGRLPHE